MSRRAVRLQTGGPFLEVLLVESPPSVRDAELRQRVSVETDQALEEESEGEEGGLRKNACVDFCKGCAVCVGINCVS